ncbi:MAG: alkaline phosphatase family protein [Bacteroidota bacterium]
MNKPRKILLLGWDAADWKVINPLLAQGLMPNFQKLVDNGTIANLATLDPAFSPMLWTSIATGKRPYKHGVLGFTEPHPNGKDIRPVMSVSRKCKAIWNILSEQEYKTHVTGWWPSHPAEPINGVMISNFYQNTKGTIDQPWPMPPGTVSPAGKSDEYERYRVHFQEMTGEHIVPFVPKAAQINQKQQKRLGSIATITAHASSLHAAFTHLLQHEEWDFAALYLDAIDHYCHGFMKYHPPKRPHIAQDEFDYYNYVVTAGYRFHDMMLGRIMELIDEDTLLMLVSDHGFQPDHLRPRDIPNEPAGPAYEHSPYGVLAAMGPGIKKGHTTFGASLLDITPTLLAAMGLPLGEDMDGRVIQGLFEKEIPVTTRSTWETEGWSPLTVTGDEENVLGADEAVQQLRDLGYLPKAAEKDKTKQLKMTRDNCQFNLARAYIDGGKIKLAAEVLEELHQENPNVPHYMYRLASCYQSLGKLVEARAMITALRELHAYTPVVLDVMEGALLLGENKAAEAIPLFKRAERAKDFNYQGQINLQLAQCYMQLGRWQEAQWALEKETEIDPHNASAYHLLGMTFLQQKYYDRSVDACLKALELDFNSPNYHLTLGNALFKLGRYESAAQALENAVSIAPQYNKGRQLLMTIYRHHLGDIAKHDHHKKLIAKFNLGTVYIVSGLPRSGTSMMMQMLMAGGLTPYTDENRAADDNNPRGYYEHDVVKSLGNNKNWVLEARDKVVKVVVPLVQQLPAQLHYKIIFMERDLQEILDSQDRMLIRDGKRKESTLRPADLLGGKYRNMLKAAKQWAETSSNVDVLYVDYRRAVAEPFAVAMELNHFLNQDLAVEHMAQAVDRKLYRERLSTP